MKKNTNPADETKIATYKHPDKHSVFGRHPIKTEFL